MVLELTAASLQHSARHTARPQVLVTVFILARPSAEEMEAQGTEGVAQTCTAWQCPSRAWNASVLPLNSMLFSGGFVLLRESSEGLGSRKK